MKKLLSTTLSLISLFILSTSSILATNPPDFPSCNQPRGTVKVSYESGQHAIPGYSSTVFGSDTVYIVSDTRVLQCFCAPDHAGIQTNWWKLNSLDPDQINYLKNLGWILIADGSAWGLDAAPYLAFNLDYNCGPVEPTPTIPVPTPTTPPAPTPTETPAPQPCNGCGNWPGAPVCTAAKPPAPVLTSVVRSGSKAILTWTAVTPATHYSISYGLKADNFIFGVANTGNVTTYEISYLDPNTRYYFSVRAVNDCMPGDPSTTGRISGSSSVLGLAATGNLGMISLFFALSALFTLVFFFLRKTKRAV